MSWRDRPSAVASRRRFAIESRGRGFRCACGKSKRPSQVICFVCWKESPDWARVEWIDAQAIDSADRKRAAALKLIEMVKQRKSKGGGYEGSRFD